LNTADTPSPNSRPGGEIFFGVFHTTPDPGKGREEGWTMEDKFSLSSTEREVSVRSRNSNWRK